MKTKLNNKKKVYLAISFITALVCFLNFNLVQDPEFVFLTISTFLFAILSGFLISQQTARWQTLFASIGEYDGSVHNIFRLAQTINPAFGKAIATVVWEDYKDFQKAKSKQGIVVSTTGIFFTNLQKTIKSYTASNKLDSYDEHAISNMLESLRTLQINRKQLLIMSDERISFYQMYLTIALAAVLVILIVSIPNNGEFMIGLIKALSTTSIYTVALIVFSLNDLEKDDRVFAKSSIQDLIATLKKEYPEITGGA